MKRKQIDAILVEQTKRRKKIYIYICVIFNVSLIALVFFLLFLNKNKTYYVPYKEESNIDYKVFIFDNSFYKENYLESNNQYIASLIKYINADFNYKLKVEREDINYKYKYRIEADVNVIDKHTRNSLYRVKDTIKEEDVYYSGGSSLVDINEKVDVDYNHYNDLISKFVNIYELDDVESTLTINMYVSAVGICEDLKDNTTDSVISLVIPLTTKTVAIDIENDLLDEATEKFLSCKKTDYVYYSYLTTSIVFLLLNLFLTIILIKYVMITRTAESIYDRELKKILNNYKSYIQKINNVFDLDGYQVLQVDTFIEMLEIRDTIQEPILMVENKLEKGVYFLIPSKTKILYVYVLNVADIRKNMRFNK